MSFEVRPNDGTPKTPWEDKICQICDTKKAEDEKHFLLDCPTLNHIRSQFPIINHTSNFLDFLSQPNYNNLGMLLSLLLDHINKILKNDN